jgi:hypothetical protein
MLRREGGIFFEGKLQFLKTLDNHIQICYNQLHKYTIKKGVKYVNSSF